MRITNSMMTNNMMSNINNNKNNLSLLDEQYSTGKKIQRPSQDPIIAVRALKLRTNLSELNQYYEKNIPDARSWMDVTESALVNINEMLTKINTMCVQGANDVLTASDRASIVETLKQYKEQIYLEGNSDYAGRYLFTGFKTNTSFIFEEDTKNLDYKITEEFTGNDITAFSVVKNSYKVDDTNITDAPQLHETHRLRLAYENLDGIESVVVDPNAAINVVEKSVTDAGVYEPSGSDVYFIKETGELIIGPDAYEAMKDAKISVTYNKSSFNKGDIRPEHYFDCEINGTKYEIDDEGQKIQYEINFNQKLTVNTEARDAFTHSIGRDIEDILNAVDAVETLEANIAEVKKRLEDPTISTTEKDRLTKLQGYYETELTLKTSIMQKAFERGIAGSKNTQQSVNVQIADIGTRYVRLDLTESRLSDQQVDFEDLLSNNEDADIAETYIKLTAAETIYTASLNAASKVVRNNLLDFL